MGKSEKFMVIIAVIALMVNCVYLNFRVNELENRVSVIESDQTHILRNMNEAVNIARELVMRITEQKIYGEK